MSNGIVVYEWIVRERDGDGIAIKVGTNVYLKTVLNGHSLVAIISPRQAIDLASALQAAAIKADRSLGL